MRFGVHMPLRGGLLEAFEGASRLGCETIQVFSRNPRTWKEQSMSIALAMEASSKRKNLELHPLILHSIYLTNLSSEDESVYIKSKESLNSDICKAILLNAEYLVVHIRMGKNPVKNIAKIISAIDNALDKSNNINILLENTSRADPDRLYWDFIKDIFKGSRHSSQLGLCLDTCHAYASGIKLSNKDGWNELLRIIDKKLGLERLKLIHANDCLSELGSGWDRHQHIGKGRIGIEGFRIMVNHPLLHHLPVILETPKRTPQDDRRNLKIIRSLVK